MRHVIIEICGPDYYATLLDTNNVRVTIEYARNFHRAWEECWILATN